MMAEEKTCDVVCDLCEDEPAVSFCDECHSKVCTFCQDLHIKQKQTKTHNLTIIEEVKVLVLNVKCSLCDGQAERFCTECNVRLCTKCAASHHKRCDIPRSLEQDSGYNASDGQVITVMYDRLDQTTNHMENSNEGISHDSSKILSEDSMPQRSATVFKDVHQQSVSLCDLCEEEIAACICEDCQKKLCALCQQGHTKQKRTKDHKLSAIENTKPFILHAICALCNRRADKLCNQCEVRFCTKCSDAHHYLSDTLIPRKQVSNSEPECGDQVSGRHLRPGLLVYKSDTMNPKLLPPESGINQAGFNQVGDEECDGEVLGKVNRSKGRSAGGGTGKCVNHTSCQVRSAIVDNSDGNGKQGDKPGKPVVEKIYTNSVDIVWAGVDNFCEGDVYQVRTENIIQTNKWHNQNFKINNGKITGLEPGGSYVFKVRMIKANGEKTGYNDTSEVVTTHRTYASEMVCTLSPVIANRNGPDIFALPMQEIELARDDKTLTRTYDIGSRAKENNEKTIMFVGATGTGKSTLVDGLANYVMGVRLCDPFRFTPMKDGNKETQNTQAISQTDWIITYSFNPESGTRLSYRLNVIDTPGFEDTRELDRDHKIVDQILHLFEAPGKMGVQTIDAVCFLIKAPDFRLTATHTYIVKAIVSLYGNEIERKICTLITFADGSDPPVLSAMKASLLPFGKTFTFNNSALFSNPSNHFTIMFWEMGLQSFEAFITHISLLETQSIQLTKEVLQTKNRLEVKILNLQLKIKVCLDKIDSLNFEIKFFHNNQEEIKRNAQFTYEATEVKLINVDLPPGIYVTNCVSCNRTCCEGCSISNDGIKIGCVSMGPDGYCRQCPNKCYWNLHRKAAFKTVIVTEKVQKTYDMMKYKGIKPVSFEHVLNEMEEERRDITSQVEAMVDSLRKCNNQLKEICLRPNPIGIVAQIDFMIQDEKHEGKSGYLRRIKVLKQFRQRVDIGESINKFKQKTGSVRNVISGVL